MLSELPKPQSESLLRIPLPAFGLHSVNCQVTVGLTRHKQNTVIVDQPGRVGAVLELLV